MQEVEGLIEGVEEEEDFPAAEGDPDLPTDDAEPNLEPQEPEEEGTLEPEDQDDDQDEDDGLEGELEEEDEDAPEEPQGNRPWPKSFKRRIGKLQKKIQELNAQLAEHKTAGPAETPAPVSGSVAEALASPAERAVHAAIAERKSQMTTVNGWLKVMEEGETPTDAKGNPIRYSADQLRELKEQLGEEIADHKAELRDARKELRAQQARLVDGLKTRHPWTQDKSHPLTATLEGLIQQHPILQHIPAARIWLADGLAYQSLLNRAAQKRSAKKPSAKAPTPGTQPRRPTGAPTPAGARRAARGNRDQKFLETGDMDIGRQIIEEHIPA